MKKKIIIVGAGGFGREVYCWILGSAKHEWHVVGFIDDNEDALKGYQYEVPVLATIKEYTPKSDEFLVMGIASSVLKKRIVADLKARGASFLAFIHPAATLGRNVTIGAGSVLCPHSVLTCDITVGDFATINCFSCVGHDAIIGSYSTLSPHAAVTGFAKIGSSVLLGTHASVLPGVCVGDDTVVGAGAVVVRKVKKGTTVFGNPAKVIFEQKEDQM